MATKWIDSKLLGAKVCVDAAHDEVEFHKVHDVPRAISLPPIEADNAEQAILLNRSGGFRRLAESPSSRTDQQF